MPLPPRNIVELCKLFPWTASLPERLQQGLLWDPSVSPPIFQSPGQLLLYAGLSDDASLDAYILKDQPALKDKVLAFDIRRTPSHDILKGDLYSSLCVGAWRGQIQGVGGGPNCRTWSILRWFPKPGAPKPVRGRKEPECWGFSVLSPQEIADTDNDSLLLLRQLLIASIIQLKFAGPGLPWCFLEHPEDPDLCSSSPNAHKCSTIWKTRAVQSWIKAMGLTTIHFDECQLGQCVEKSTVLATDLPLHHWQGLKCTHGSHGRSKGMTSSDLSRYPPQMMQGLCTAIIQHLNTKGREIPPEDGADGLQLPGVPVLPEVTDRPDTTPVSRLQSLLDPTIMVKLGFKVRPLRDGGGKPSPGRTPPPLRRPSSTLTTLGKQILEIAGPLTSQVMESIHRQDKQHPFSENILVQVRDLVPGDHPGTPHEGQPFYLDHLFAIATLAEDPDADYFNTLKVGVPLGVDTPPLCSPNIWPTKEELRGEPGEEVELDTPTGRSNYISAETYSADIRKTFLEERSMDMVMGPHTAEEAAKICQCQISELCPGPMAAIDEGDKIRTIYDGSWGGANAHIQANCSERTTAPTVMDCLHGIHWLQASQKEPQAKKLPYAHWDWPKKDDQWMLLKADVTKAHRRVKILPAEWKYQVARLGSEWWINKVGTYGMASAQLYWGRAAALLLRILYKVFPMVDWGFVFVDDFCWLLRKTTSELLTTALLLFLTAFGCPLSWKKTAIGASNTWLGFVVTPHLQLVRMAPTKHELVMGILTKMMANDSFTRSELDSALGRLQWATTCCPLTKPFLQSFWQWKSAVKTSGKPSKLLRGFAHLLHSLFAKDYNHPSPYAPRSEWWGASDASANDQEAYVGGWLTNVSDPLKAQVWWFHYQVTQDRHSWAFKDLKPKRRIAALEMFGTLLLTMYLCEKSASTRGPVILPLMSDNQGNVYGLLNDYTKKMPTAGLLMEIMFQLTAHSCSLMASHVKRDFNQWADDLTHPTYEGFDATLRLDVERLLGNFRIFPWILSHLDHQGDLHPSTDLPTEEPAPAPKKRRKC